MIHAELIQAPAGLDEQSLHHTGRLPQLCTPHEGTQEAQSEANGNSPANATAVRALVDAVERAQLAEHASSLTEKKCSSLEALLGAYEKVLIRSSNQTWK